MIQLPCRHSFATKHERTPYQRRRLGTALFELIAFLVPLVSMALFGLAVLGIRAAETGATVRVHRDVNRLATDPSWRGPERDSWSAVPMSHGARFNTSAGPQDLSLGLLPTSIIGGIDATRIVARAGVFGTVGPVSIERGALIRREAWTWERGAISYTQTNRDTNAVRQWFTRGARWSHGGAWRPLRLATN